MGVAKMLKRILYANFATCGSKAMGILAPLTIPPLHIAFLYYFWQEYSRDVDKQYCSCSCWDTVFKGSYESGIASYKHMYFNATTNTLKIWITVVIGIIIFYETVKYLTWLAFQNRLRLSMTILFSTAVFSHYYSWWVYMNYWNDEFYSQWYHQLFFSVTELISTLLVVRLADNKNPVTRRKAFAIAAIAILHILAGGWDQFVANVVRGEGYAHQVVRDLGFMIPDILHVCVPLWAIKWRNVYSLPAGSMTNAPRRGLDAAAATAAADDDDDDDGYGYGYGYGYGGGGGGGSNDDDDDNNDYYENGDDDRHSSIRRDLAYMLATICIGLCVSTVL